VRAVYDEMEWFPSLFRSVVDNPGGLSVEQEQHQIVADSSMKPRPAPQKCPTSRLRCAATEIDAHIVAGRSLDHGTSVSNNRDIGRALSTETTTLKVLVHKGKPFFAQTNSK